MSGRRPLCFEGRFLWHPTPTDDAMESQHDYLPRDVFALLDGHIPRDNPRVDLVVKAYLSRDAAMRALRRAEVNILQAAFVAVADEMIRTGYAETRGLLTPDTLRYRLVGIMARHLGKHLSTPGDVVGVEG